MTPHTIAENWYRGGYRLAQLFLCMQCSANNKGCLIASNNEGCLIASNNKGCLIASTNKDSNAITAKQRISAYRRCTEYSRTCNDS